MLHSELEKQNRALEESQEEAKLAAEIGQSLLLENQHMSAVMETTQHEMSSELSEAKNEIQVCCVS